MAQTFDTLPLGQQIMLRLMRDYHWQTHQMGTLKFEDYRDRFVWLHANMDRPLPSGEPVEFSDMYRWYGMPTYSHMGLVDGVLLAFKDPADLTMYALRWS